MPEIPEGREFSDGMAALDAVDHSHIAEIYDTLLPTPEGFRLTSRPRITRMVNQLLGDDPEAPLFDTQCGVLLFMPRDAEQWYTWHKDIFYTVPVRLGQVLLFDPGMIHRSGNNTSGTCRFTLLGFFHKIENERFRPLLLRQAYVGKTLDQYFAELFGVDV